MRQCVDLSWWLCSDESVWCRLRMIMWDCPGLLDPQVWPAHPDGGPGLIHQRPEVLPHPPTRLRRVEPPHLQPRPQGQRSTVLRSGHSPSAQVVNLTRWWRVLTLGPEVQTISERAWNPLDNNLQVFSLLHLYGIPFHRTYSMYVVCSGLVVPLSLFRQASLAKPIRQAA
jgi:hypothetical protein